ncbi:unnamed protein product [Owenia fusiformis]|uniref:Uncharacterized protein n=1 Tax=Owenia fusiformis TaxID=6347 RepID=A0A8J1TS99_OWEFU|nr:unnamed protein product [Owenia fusiformis]
MIRGIIRLQSVKQLVASPQCFTSRHYSSSQQNSKTAMERKKTLYYPLLPNLPEKLHTSNGVYIIDIPTDSQLVEAYDLFQTTIDRDDGYGVDDYPNLEFFINYMSHDSVVPFVLYQQPEKKVVVFFNTCPSRFCRGVNPVYCGGNTVFHDSVKRHGLYHKIISEIFWKYAGLLGYEGFLGETFVNNKKVLHTILDRHNWKLLGELPKISKLKHSGWVNSFAVVKLFKDIDEKMNAEYRVSKVIVPDPDISQITLNNHTKKIDNLPRQCITHNGAQLMVDYATEEDIEPIYDMFVKAQNEGDGYAIDEYPTFNHFVYKLRKGHLFSMKVKGHLVGSMAVIPCRFVRSAFPNIGAGPMLVDKQYRGKGNFSKLLLLHALFCKELGYEGSMGDTFATSKSVLNVAGGLKSDTGSEILARIPRTGYIANKGWTDSYIMYRDLSDLPLEFMNKHIPSLLPNGKTSKL